MTTHCLTHYAKAIAFIQQHGHFATVTTEGLLARSGAILVDSFRDEEGLKHDNYFEEYTVFPINDDNTVDRKAVRNWVGY